jgi:hypothetical protein
MAQTFDQLVDQAAQGIHLALLEGGGKAFRNAVHVYLHKAVNDFSREVKKKPKRTRRTNGWGVMD